MAEPKFDVGQWKLEQRVADALMPGGDQSTFARLMAIVRPLSNDVRALKARIGQADRTLTEHCIRRDVQNAVIGAVRDLHKADEYGCCIECGVDVGENPIPWPCDTILAMERAEAAEKARTR